MIAIMLFASCSNDFLDYEPRGTVNSDQINSPEEVDKLVTAAYASIGNDDRFFSFTHQWVLGSIRSDDAYKGGGGVSNRIEWHNFETFSSMTVDQAPLNDIWVGCYDGIGRANEALRRMEDLTEEEYPNKLVRQAESRFIRGHFYFLLKTVFKYPVWADISVPKEELNKLTNREYSNDELWNKIAEDFQFAVDNLPESQPEIGRASKVSAWAYLAKTRLYQAYEQDEQHNVVNINTERLQEVVQLCDNVINSGKHSLWDNFGKNFLFEFDNGPESVFAIQYSIGDGVEFGRTNRTVMMNYPMAPEYGCCWFHVPSQNLVNAFKTDANGLPMFDTFNDTEMKEPIDFLTNTVDPRLDHTVGIPTHPYKYLPDFIYSIDWARVPNVYGPFSTMKEISQPDSPGLNKIGAYFASAQNVDIIRYDDVLLMKAEALIELNRHPEALELINQIRERAQNSTEWLKYTDDSYPSNYKVKKYVDGVNCSWTQDFARDALRWERRLEFAMESPRFLDLVRWGIAAETLNEYFEVESTRYSFLKEAYFTEGRDEYLPIPQEQIDLVEGIYIQNNDY